MKRSTNFYFYSHYNIFQPAMCSSKTNQAKPQISIFLFYSAKFETAKGSVCFVFVDAASCFADLIRWRIFNSISTETELS